MKAESLQLCRADCQRAFQPMSFGGHFRHYRLSVCWRYRFIRPEHKTAFTARFPVDNRLGQMVAKPFHLLNATTGNICGCFNTKDRNAALRAGPTPGIEATSIKIPPETSASAVPLQCHEVLPERVSLLPVTREFRPSFFEHRPFGDKTFRAAYLLDLAD